CVQLSRCLLDLGIEGRVTGVVALPSGVEAEKVYAALRVVLEYKVGDSVIRYRSADLIGDPFKVALSIPVFRLENRGVVDGLDRRADADILRHALEDFDELVVIVFVLVAG